MLGNIEDQYHNLLNFIQTNGYEITNDRTGVGTKKEFGHFMKFQVSENEFPIITSKFVHFKSIVVELLWMLNGDDNTDYLKKHGVSIWDEWADDNGDLNGVYGKQWRSWDHGPSKRVIKTQSALKKEYENSDDPEIDSWKILYNDHTNGEPIYYKWENCVDQVIDLIDTIKNNPNDRRQLVSSWNVGKIEDMNLPPCHHTWQTFVKGDTLELMMHQRSCDMFLGVPFNLTGYSLLLCILARLTDKKPGLFNWTGGDCHIYSNHYEQVEKQMDNYYTNASSNTIKYPKLVFDEAIDFTSLKTFLETTLNNPERISLDGYKHMGSIKAPVAV